MTLSIIWRIIQIEEGVRPRRITHSEICIMPHRIHYYHSLKIIHTPEHPYLYRCWGTVKRRQQKTCNLFCNSAAKQVEYRCCPFYHAPSKTNLATFFVGRQVRSWVVKRTTSPFNSFATMLQNKLRGFYFILFFFLFARFTLTLGSRLHVLFLGKFRWYKGILSSQQMFKLPLSSFQLYLYCPHYV